MILLSFQFNFTDVLSTWACGFWGVFSWIRSVWSALNVLCRGDTELQTICFAWRSRKHGYTQHLDIASVVKAKICTCKWQMMRIARFRSQLLHCQATVDYGIHYYHEGSCLPSWLNRNYILEPAHMCACDDWWVWLGYRIQLVPCLSHIDTMSHLLLIHDR